VCVCLSVCRSYSSWLRQLESNVKLLLLNFVTDLGCEESVRPAEMAQAVDTAALFAESRPPKDVTYGLYLYGAAACAEN